MISDIIGLIFLFISLCLLIFALWFNYAFDELVKRKEKDFIDKLSDDQKVLFLEYYNIRKMSAKEVFKRHERKKPTK